MVSTEIVLTSPASDPNGCGFAKPPALRADALVPQHEEDLDAALNLKLFLNSLQ